MAANSDPPERLGSGDGEGWALNTQQIAFEPLPASVLFAIGSVVFIVYVSVRTSGDLNQCRK
jgi:hypothetical protein